MNKSIACGMAAMTLLGCLIAAHGQVGRSAPAQSSIPAEVRKAGEARVKAAEEVITAYGAREQAGEPLSPEFLGRMTGAMRNLAMARLDLATTREQRAQAVEEYLEATRKLLQTVEARLGQDTSRFQLVQAQYEVADAEYLLVRIRAGL
jgi:glutathione S-transferase